ncbi:MAG: histidine phosphatase family protein [Brumimicrobium sp.]
MKLFLLRHAEAESFSTTGSDFNRELSQRGNQQINQLGAFVNIVSKKTTLTVLCSSAKRTKQTFEGIKNDIEIESIRFIKEIYYADQQELLELIKSIDDAKENVLLIGHNNAISYFASHLIGEDIIFPTAGFVEINFPVVNRWKYIGADVGIIANKNF